MKTNFFENIAGLNIPGIWKLVIQTDAEGQMTVSELFTATACGDTAAKAIAPMVLSGTSAELDDVFFDMVSAPAVKAAGLYNNMEAHLKSVEEARLKSKMEQDAKAKEAKEKKESVKTGNGTGDIEVPKVSKEEKKKVYDEAMKKVNDLSAACKYADALAILPLVEEYPEKKTELEKKAEDLKRFQKMYDHQSSLFNKEEQQP